MNTIIIAICTTIVICTLFVCICISMVSANKTYSESENKILLKDLETIGETVRSVEKDYLANTNLNIVNRIEDITSKYIKNNDRITAEE